MTIPGVKGIRFEAADPPTDPSAPKPSGARKVIVVSDETLTQDDAVKSLGKKATRYVVTGWTDPEPGAAEDPQES